MARPSKSLDNMSKNLTKGEEQRRRRAEKAALSGIAIREWPEVKADEEAHKEFRRVKKLLAAVGKDDAMYEAVINDYCAYKGDIERYRRYREDIQKDLDDFINEDGVDPSDRYKIKVKMRDEIFACDNQISKLQKKRFDIEKETGFTVASALRSIPKKREKAENPLLKVLLDDG